MIASRQEGILCPEVREGIKHLYDITVPMHTSLACWPGDARYQFAWSMRKRDGYSVNLGSVHMSVHTGTHADAPYHFEDDGQTIDEVDLSIYCGPAVVIEVRNRAVIGSDDVPASDLKRAPRVLFKTSAWTDHTRFPQTVPVIAPDLPDYLKAHGIMLVGIDVPSVDPIESKDLCNHHALAASGISILESLTLEHVPEGVYELIALPLKLVGADGAPVRAILRR